MNRKIYIEVIFGLPCQNFKQLLKPNIGEFNVKPLYTGLLGRKILHWLDTEEVNRKMSEEKEALIEEYRALNKAVESRGSNALLLDSYYDS